jgi:Protein of unknown function (DUF4230)
MTNQSTNDPSQDPTSETEPTVVYVREPGRSRWGRRLLVLVGTIGVIAALVFGLKAVNLWPQIKNPFATTKTDRTGPVLLESIHDLSRYVAAEGNFQVLVDLQENKKFIPDVIFNERTLFVGVGSVNAYVDFSTIGEGAVVVSPDGKTVDIKLPEPELEKPSLDTERSYVFAQDRGIVNRIGAFVGNDANKQQQLYQLAQDKIAAAANDSELRTRAKKNTQSMLESLMKGLGYQRVNITFVAP